MSNGDAVQSWREAVELGARLGVIAADKAKDATAQLDAATQATLTPALVAAWADISSDTLEGLLHVARTWPKNRDALELRDSVRIASQGLAALKDALGETAETVIRGAQAGAKKRPPSVPRRLGPYELLDILGHGGMGVVYRARHATLGTECAVKVLVAGEHASPEAITRFQREAAALARMGKHPNIVGVFDLGREGPLFYYAMELVRGRSLREVFESGTLEPREAARLVEKIARALHFAHGHGIVHRDMKPENVVVREDGEPQVMDFGLARDLRSEARLSVAGEVFGTPAYMAPEQAKGLHDQCDARTDVYALGGVLYDALTGIPPHPGKDVAQVFRHACEGEVVPPRRIRPDLSVDLETVCLKCLDAERESRYASAEALADDLARFLRGKAVSARPRGWVERQVRRVRRRPLQSALVGGLVLALVGLSWRLAGPARVRIQTEPDGARLEAIGRTMWGGGWVWPAGRFTLRVTAEGYDPRDVSVDLSPGSLHDLGTVKLLPTPAALTLTSWPPEVEVTLARDGGGLLRLSTRFDRLPVGAGTYSLHATREGYFPFERRVEARPGASVACNLTLRRKTLWVRDLEDIIDGAPAVVDLDRDGALDVVVCARTQCTVYALSGRDGSILWRSRVGHALLEAATIEDIDRDGVPDVRVKCMEGHSHALDGRDGSPIASDREGSSIATPATLDLDGDGFLDEVHAEAGKVIASSVRGDGIASVSREAERIDAAPTIADLDGDGTIDGLKLSGYALVEATLGKTRERMWSSLFMEGVSAAPIAGDLDGDGAAECVVACDPGEVIALEGKTGARRWTWRIAGQPKGPLALARANGRAGLDVVVSRADGRAFVLTPPEASVGGPLGTFERMLAHRAAGENWTALERLAEEVTKDDDPWRRSIGWSLLGIARQRAGRPEEALACFAEARGLDLRCPEAAAAEWTASWAWKACPGARREEAGRLFEEGLRHDPDRLFDSVLEGCEAIDAAAARDLAERVREELDDPGCGVEATLLSTLLLPNDTRPPAPAEVERRLHAAVDSVRARLAEVPSQAPRLFGYLCLLYDALGDEARYRAAFAIYTEQPRRPSALDALMFHVNARYGLK